MLWNVSKLSLEKFNVVTVRPGHVMLLKGVCDMSLRFQPRAIVVMLRVRHGDTCWKDDFFPQERGCSTLQWVPCMVGHVLNADSGGGYPSSHFRCLCFSF